MTIYVQHLSALQKSFNELMVLSNKRLADLETLLDFIQSATTELIWLNEKEEIEIARDWSSKSLNVTEIERYYEVGLAEHLAARSMAGRNAMPSALDPSHQRLAVSYPWMTSSGYYDDNRPWRY